MGITKTVVTGPALGPDENALSNATIRFQLSTFGTNDGTDTLVIDSYVEVAMSDSDGSFTVDLWPNGGDSRGSVYAVTIFQNIATGTVSYPLGNIIVPDTGPVALEDLLDDFAADPATVGSTYPYDVQINVDSVPITDEVVQTIPFVRSWKLPVSLSGSRVLVGTNPTAGYTFTLKDDGASIATIAIATDGVATLATTSAAVTTVAAGSDVILQGQTTVDATLNNVSIVIKGSI